MNNITMEAAEELVHLIQMDRTYLYEKLTRCAITNPKLFLECMTGIAPKDDTTWQNFVRQGQKINAIKEYRSLYDSGLLEAKKAVEAWGEDNGYFPRRDYDPYDYVS